MSDPSEQTKLADLDVLPFVIAPSCVHASPVFTPSIVALVECLYDGAQILYNLDCPAELRNQKGSGYQATWIYLARNMWMDQGFTAEILSKLKYSSFPCSPICLKVPPRSSLINVSKDTTKTLVYCTRVRKQQNAICNAVRVLIRDCSPPKGHADLFSWPALFGRLGFLHKQHGCFHQASKIEKMLSSLPDSALKQEEKLNTSLLRFEIAVLDRK